MNFKAICLTILLIFQVHSSQAIPSVVKKITGAAAITGVSTLAIATTIYLQKKATVVIQNTVKDSNNPVELRYQHPAAYRLFRK